MYVYIYLRKYFVIHIAAKLVITYINISPIFLMVCSGISEASHVYILYLFEKILFFIHIAAKLLTNSIFTIFLMVRSGISEASH